jgi:methionyl-tRNA formyltransferase
VVGEAAEKTRRLRIVFCGTPQFAVPTLKFLLSQPDFEIAGVITQPDRASGRGMAIKFSAVKVAALAAGVTVHQPEKIRAAESRGLLEKIAPDVIVIIAYGQIIPAALLPIPKLGWINLHGSLLPKYRGAAPIQWAIVNGETRTGLTTMRIDAGMDTGDMLLQEATEIGPSETTPQLAARLSEMGAPLMTETLRGIGAGILAARTQQHEYATYAPLLKKEDGKIAWSRTAGEIYNRMRGFTPWPGSFSTFRGDTCQISGEPASKEMSAAASVNGGTFDPNAVPGTIRVIAGAAQGSGGEVRVPSAKQGTMLVTCGGATELQVVSVKLPGGRPTDAWELVNGMQLTEGERFGER